MSNPGKKQAVPQAMRRNYAQQSTGEEGIRLTPAAPNPKVPTAALGGSSLARVILWTMRQFGLTMDTETAIAFAGVLTFWWATTHRGGASSVGG